MSDTLAHIKQSIWSHRKVNRSPVAVQEAADRAGIRLPINTVEEAQKLLDFINKPKRVKRTIRLTDEQYKRYRDAKYAHDSIEFPVWVKDGHFIEPENPDVGTANGLTGFIVQHATWMGCHANRINTSGRNVNGKWITGTTKKGTSDTALIIQGRSIHLEVKAGKDTPSPHQLKQQEQVRKAGGVYEFIHNADEYFAVFDRYYSKQVSIFDAT